MSLQRAIGNAGVEALLLEDEEPSPVRDVVGSGTEARSNPAPAP